MAEGGAVQTSGGWDHDVSNIHGSVSMRVNQADLPWPPLEEQVDRFLTKLVGVPPASL
jgi:hypothetical protein